MIPGQFSNFHKINEYFFNNTYLKEQGLSSPGLE